MFFVQDQRSTRNRSFPELRLVGKLYCYFSIDDSFASFPNLKNVLAEIFIAVLSPKYPSLEGVWGQFHAYL